MNINRNNFVVAKAKILDKFNLPILEDTTDNDYYTVAEIKREVEKRIDRLSTLGSYYTIKPEYLTNYEIINSNNKEVIAQVEAVGEHKYLFKLSKQAAKKRNEKYLDTIIYHELCHILQIECLVNFDIMNFVDDTLGYDISKKVLVDNWFYKDDYHTDIWKTFVAKVNSVFEVVPPVDRFLNNKDAVDLFLEDTFRSDTFISADVKITDRFDILED